MKSFDSCKLPLVLLALGGVLVLAPGARAQSDVAPDHFDGTDSWASARPKSQAASPTQQVRSSHSGAPALKPVAAHELTANKKRKPAARKSTNQSN
jgi:hypothetical protein